VLINLHGGAFAVGADLRGLIESIPVAGSGGIKVISVDYRQGPENRFPAASEDVAQVYRELLKTYQPRNIGIYGCSAGGVLAAMAVAWIQRQKLPTPGAVGIFAAGAFGGFYDPPAAPGSWGGDSRFTTPPLIGHKPIPADPKQTAPSASYLSGYLSHADLSDPLVSPALSPNVMARFPPTLLITGTRAYDMSAAVQTQRVLTKVGVEADLHLWDGMGHCFFIDVDLPESQEAFAVMTKFFDTHLGNRARKVRKPARSTQRRSSASPRNPAYSAAKLGFATNAGSLACLAMTRRISLFAATTPREGRGNSLAIRRLTAGSA
jgi:acetyl esterase/lipase